MISFENSKTKKNCISVFMKVKLPPLLLSYPNEHGKILMYDNPLINVLLSRDLVRCYNQKLYLYSIILVTLLTKDLTESLRIKFNIF